MTNIFSKENWPSHATLCHFWIILTKMPVVAPAYIQTTCFNEMSGIRYNTGCFSHFIKFKTLIKNSFEIALSWWIAHFKEQLNLLKIKQNFVQGVFLAKKAYKLKEISLFQQVSLPAYPKDGHPIYSLIKNILSNFEKYVFVKHVPPKHKNLGQKTKTWSRIFLNCQSEKRHRHMLFLFLPH